MPAGTSQASRPCASNRDVRSTTRSAGMIALAGRAGKLAGAGRNGFVPGRRGIRMAEIERLFVDVGDPLSVVGLRHGQHCHVGIEIVDGSQYFRRQSVVAEVGRSRRRPRQHGVELRGPADVDRAGHHVLHRLLRLDPRAAAPRPAGSGVERDLQPQPLRFGNRMFEKSPPLGAHKLHRPLRDAHVDLHQEHAADACSLHGLEVGGNALAGEVAVHNEVIHPRPRRRRRVLEARGEHVRTGGLVLRRRGWCRRV